MEIGSKIKELRMKNGLTQEELADRSELSKGFISQLEKRCDLAVNLDPRGYSAVSGYDAERVFRGGTAAAADRIR